jgi:integrase
VCHLGQNTIRKDIKIIKTVMQEAFDLEYTTNQKFKNKRFSIKEAETDSVYLTYAEIMQLYEFDLSGEKTLEGVRDLFVYATQCGLRISDFTNIHPENIVYTKGEKKLRMITKKTGEEVIIPYTPLMHMINAKYPHTPNNLPEPIADATFNEYIKKACRKAGLTERGRLVTNPHKELCDCIEARTARRSFATNLHWHEGVPMSVVMRITGHRTEKAFSKYIKVDKLSASAQLAEFYKTQSITQMRVAG